MMCEVISCRCGSGSAGVLALLLVAAVSAAIADSPSNNVCTGVKCPLPPQECPEDSVLKIYDFPAAKSDDEDEITRRFSPKFQHTLQKRSLQAYRRRERIQIIPVDAKYFEQYLDQHRMKRDVIVADDPEIAPEVLEQCCTKFACECADCKIPKCDYMDEVVVATGNGSTTPGECCPRYECVLEPECDDPTDENIDKEFWVDDCNKCQCANGFKACEDVCEQNRDFFTRSLTCFSTYLQRPFENSDSWLENDDCTECTCVNGFPRCVESFCKPLSCERSVKVEGSCCRVCVEGEEEEATTETADVGSSTSETPSTAYQEESSTSEYTSPTTQYSETPSVSTETTLSSSRTTLPLSETTLSTFTTTETSTERTYASSYVTQSSERPSSTTKGTTLPSSIPVLPTSTSTTTEKSIISTPTHSPSTAETPVASTEPKTTSTPFTTHPPATPDRSADTFDSFEDGIFSDQEFVIMYILIAILLTLCAILSLVFVHQHRQKKIYSTIPSTDSSVSSHSLPPTPMLGLPK